MFDQVCLTTCIFIEVNVFVSVVPAGPLTRVLSVGSHVEKKNKLIFPDNISFSCASNLGRAKATKNVIFQ